MLAGTPIYVSSTVKMAIHHDIETLVVKRSFTAAILISLSVLGAVFLILREIVKPTGLRRTHDGRKSRLPPGPRGIPIFGNLLQLAKVRYEKDAGWVSANSIGGGRDF